LVDEVVECLRVVFLIRATVGSSEEVIAGQVDKREGVYVEVCPNGSSDEDTVGNNCSR
jgi:hypothetical protein